MSIERTYWENDATGLADLIGKGEISAAEAVDAAIARAESVNPKINAVAEKLYDDARKAAANAPGGKPFSGVPIAIKDLAVSMTGVTIHSGSRIPPLKGEADSVIVQRYREAGFIPVATSTTPEFGLRLVTETARFGITRNPWNTGHVTGGSSGGSAALVAAGVVPVAHASDGGGSIRVPSACNGLVGMKPSRGRVPLTHDAMESWYGFIVQHAVTRSVRDSARMLDFSSAHDPLSPYVARPPKTSFADAAEQRPKGLKIAVFRRSPLDLPVSVETMAAMDEAERLVREAGHEVTEIDLPMANRDFMTDFARCVASAHAGAMRTQAARVGRSVLGDLERTTRVLARFGDIFSGGEIQAALTRLQDATMALLAQSDPYDAVLMPIIAEPPLETGGLDSTGVDLASEIVLDRLGFLGSTRLLRIPLYLGQLLDQSLKFTHWPAIQNVTGQPSVALPVHVTDKGLPLGIQAVGRMGGEETLYALAGQLEEISGWLTRRAPLDVPG